MSRWENGHDKPTLESVVKILGALRRDLGDLQAILSGDYMERLGETAQEKARVRHEKVRLAYSDAWRARVDVSNLMAEGVQLLEDSYRQADRRERSALIELLAVASRYHVDDTEGYFGHLSIRELWAHFRALEHRFPGWVAEDPGLPMAIVGRKAESRWGEDLRRAKPGGDFATEQVIQRLERLEERLEEGLRGVEDKLDDLENQL